MGYSQFTLDYSVGRKAFCYHLSARLDPDAPPRSSTEILTVTVGRRFLSLYRELDQESGHARRIVRDPAPLVDFDPSESLEPLAAHLRPDLFNAVDALLADGARWSAEQLGQLFVPKPASLSIHDAPVDEAEVWELGRSQSDDGKVPYLALRVGREHSEIVLDRCDYAWDEGVPHRQLDPLVPHAEEAEIRERFGSEMVAVERWLREEKFRR